VADEFNLDNVPLDVQREVANAIDAYVRAYAEALKRALQRLPAADDRKLPESD
jgi:hypothetical protein